MALGDDDSMGNDSATVQRPSITERDIVFDCDRCDGQLVVDRAGEGMEVQCPHCGHSLVVPPFQVTPEGPDKVEALPEATPAAAQERFDFTGFSAGQLSRRMEELRHQLKENRSQVTEMRGHVNRATMELHRLQLKLQKLSDRQVEIEAEMSAGQQYLPQG